jgi:hypothetical protein
MAPGEDGGNPGLSGAARPVANMAVHPSRRWPRPVHWRAPTRVRVICQLPADPAWQLRCHGATWDRRRSSARAVRYQSGRTRPRRAPSTSPHHGPPSMSVVLAAGSSQRVQHEIGGIGNMGFPVRLPHEWAWLHPLLPGCGGAARGARAPRGRLPVAAQGGGAERLTRPASSGWGRRSSAGGRSAADPPQRGRVNDYHAPVARTDQLALPPLVQRTRDGRPRHADPAGEICL